MSAVVHNLKSAESPYKLQMLEKLDVIRAEIERGETVAIVFLPIHVGGVWSTRSAGDINKRELIGMLACAQFDAMSDTVE